MDYNNHLSTKTPLEFLSQTIDCTKKFVNFVTFIQDLDKKIIGKLYMFNDEPDAIRIGVVNHWFSVGLCVVWEKSESKEIKLMKLRNKLFLNQNLFKTNLNYQGMSFAVNLKGEAPGVCHWIKTPSSKKEGEYWIINESLIINYLKELSDLKIIE